MKPIISLLLLGTLTACAPALAPCPVEQQFTLGCAQKEIYYGMSQADVAAVLGSPNIVTKDNQGKETWIYDKISSEASYRQTGAGLCLILFNAGSSSGYAQTSQRTLTIVIKFDGSSNVENVSYHASRF